MQLLKQEAEQVPIPTCIEVLLNPFPIGLNETKFDMVIYLKKS